MAIGESGDLKWGDDALGTGSGVITYSVDLSSGLNRATGTVTDFENVTDDAFERWEDVADIDFVEVSSGADVVFRMESISGGVGRANISFFENGAVDTIVSGLVRMDADQTWSPTGGSGGIDFFAVALHEIGHILGLPHIDDVTEIMNPFISVDDLGDRDTAAIQRLYGVADGAVEVPPPPPLPPEESEEAPDAPEPSRAPAVDDSGGGGGAGIGGILGLLVLLLGFAFGGGGGLAMAAAAGRVAGGSDEEDEDADPIIEVEHTLFADAASAQEHGHHHGHDHGAETAEAGICPCGSGKQLADCHGHAHEAQNDDLLSDLLPHVDAGACGLDQDDETDLLDELELV